MTSASVLVAVATYKRTDLLEGLLASLQHLDMSSHPHCRVEIAIIDNDPEESARTLVTEYASTCNIPLQYYTERRPGVTHVRNRALDLASDFRFLAFVDDDEFVTPQWLSALLDQQTNTNATVVFGPVHPVYTDQAPKWIRDWAVHGRFVTVDEQAEKPGATCNCLIDMDVVRAEKLEFDPRMTFTGGEDTLFFSILMERGHAMAKSRDALVHEHIPDDRATVGWILRRWFRIGITDTLIFNRNKSSLALRATALVNGLARIIIGAPLALATAAITLGRNRAAVMKRMFTVCRGAGMVSLAFGGSYEEYGRK